MFGSSDHLERKQIAIQGKLQDKFENPIMVDYV